MVCNKDNLSMPEVRAQEYSQFTIVNPIKQEPPDP